jgi:hypothetical protein
MCFCLCRGKNRSAAKLDQAAATRLVEEAPAGDGWLHEVKDDGYGMHARFDGYMPSTYSVRSKGCRVT